VSNKDAIRVENSAWPSQGLETIDHCPVCGSTQQELLYEGQKDITFFCAPGNWNMQMCMKCGSAYLNDRPSVITIHLAYQNYYTHKQTERLPAEDLRGLRWFKRVLANGYKNWSFNTNLQPSSPLGVPLAYLMPVYRAILDRQFRHLPDHYIGSCLLDVGFGDGSFLENAKSIGWDVMGLDPDIETVNNARDRGLNVKQGSLDTLVGMDDHFDVITLCQVLEHMHDPIASLRACYRLLKPGGQIWIETPNINSIGHSRFKANWRGLEIPRHLVIFSHESLHEALHEVGFSRIKDLSQPSPCDGVYTHSQRIKEGRDPYIDSDISLLLRIKIQIDKIKEFVCTSRREFIAVKAFK